MKTLNFTIKPQGYIKNVMEEELEKRVLGNLHIYAKELFNDDIYVKDRLGQNTSPKNLGTLENDDSWNVQFYWWNSETIGNYYDGLMRYGYLLNNKEVITQVDEYLERIIESQDEDGYIGIYQDDLRYNFDSENGELWSKTTMYRTLLGYYFYTKKAELLNVVKKAVENVMINYPINNSTPFSGENTFAGTAHGLMFVDVLHTLYEITKDFIYIEYAIFLFEDYNKHDVSEKDVLLSNLKDPNYRFGGHGVHTYEHLRVIAIIAKYKSVYREYYDLYMEKLLFALSPSGGPIGDEWVMGNTAKADLHGYEFCSIHELMDSLLFVSSIGLDNQFKLAEKIFKNSNFGAKHNTHKTISYLKSDNSYSMEGSFQIDQPHSPHKVQSRYKYSPSHQDAAVCCVPNSARITPYYLEHAITVTNVVTINYIVPIFATMTLNDKEYYLSIEQDSPYSDFKIDTNLNDLLHLNHQISQDIRIIEDSYGDIYFMHKNIVFAYPIPSRDIEIKRYDEYQCDYHTVPLNKHNPLTYNGDELVLVNYGYPVIKTILYQENTPIEVELVPIGETTLRQVTFKRR